MCFGIACSFASFVFANTTSAASPAQRGKAPQAIALGRTGFDDGFGAQLQRVIATYCICKEYGFDYVHTPLANIEYQGCNHA